MRINKERLSSRFALFMLAACAWLLASDARVFGQVELKDIKEDKTEMADSYYGTYKYQGRPYTGKAFSFYEDGQIKSLRSFKNGRVNGLWIEWHPNGQMKFRGDRIENKADGVTSWWYANGQLKQRGRYKLDISLGFWLQFYETGAIKSVSLYKEGKRVSRARYDEKGNEVAEEKKT